MIIHIEDEALTQAINELLSVLRDGTWWGGRETYYLKCMPLMTLENFSTRLNHLQKMQQDGLTVINRGTWTRTQLGEETLRRRTSNAI